MKNRIKELRESRTVSQEELATVLDTTQQSISLYESGNREPKLETWQQLADYFDVSVPYLQGFKMRTPNRLRELRESQGLTLKDTVKKMKDQESLTVTADALAKYERGDREPKLEVWQELAHFFNVSVPYLQGFDEHRPNRLKELRKRNHLTLEELGHNVSMLNSTLSQYENGKRNPNNEVWQQLADYFEVSVPYLKGEIDTGQLEKLIELAIFFCFPKTNITYKDKEFGDEFKPFIIIGILSQIFNLLGSDSRDKFQKIYNKIILMADDQITFGFLSNFKSTVDETMAETEKITGNLLKAYDQL